MLRMFAFIAADLSSELLIVLSFCHQTVGNKMKIITKTRGWADSGRRDKKCQGRS